MDRVTSRRRQGGAMIVTTALVLLFLLGFMGIALDFGRLFIVKTELQTAMDSCALAAAQELDGGAEAIARAISAGKTAGNMNRIHFQGEELGLADAQITFAETLTGVYSSTPANPKYAKCEHTKAGIAPWLLGAMSAFSGDDRYRSENSVGAVAVATLAPAQTSCPLPVAVCRKTGSVTEDEPHGFSKGEWILGTVDSQDNVNGNFRWVDFSMDGGAGGNKGIKNALSGSGQCSVSSTTEMKKGANTGARAAFNTRFGIYHGGYKGPEDGMPDLTGYAWYAPSASGTMPNRYGDDTENGFLAKRAASAPYQGDDVLHTSELQTHGSSLASHTGVGANRRLALAPVIDDCAELDGGTVTATSMACILLLHPIGRPGGGSSPPVNMWLEYVGDAHDPASPCASIGLVGGEIGPRVPALAQ